MTATVHAPIADHMTYFVICKARSGGAYIVERDLSDCDRATTIADIARGEFDGFAQVLECNPVEGICRDTTEDIAWAVSAIWAGDNEPLTRWQRDFIERHLGMSAAAAFPMEMV